MSGAIGAVLVDEQIQKMLRKPARILNLKNCVVKPEPCSVDLPVGNQLWEVAGIPDLMNGFNFGRFVQSFSFNEYCPLSAKGHTLVPGRHAYLAELSTELRLGNNEHGYANPKSSTGRVDLFCAVLGDGFTEFNVIPKGFHGKLYLLIVPQSFPVILSPRIALVQIRLFDGDREFLSNRELRRVHHEYGLVDEKAEPVISDNALLLRLNLGFNPSNLVAVNTGRPVNLSARKTLPPRAYFREKTLDEAGGLWLEPNEFALLATEGVRVGPNLCATMDPINEKQGEFRSHYAGFFDRGFGYGRDGKILASTAVCEVRNTATVPIRLADGQVIARLVYEYLQHEPTQVYGEGGTSNYQGQQGITLAKYFAPWE